MHWLAIRIEVDADAAESLGDALLGAGAFSIEIADAAAGTAREQHLFGEPGSAPGAGWDRCLVTALLPHEVEPAVAMTEALCLAGLPRATPYFVQRVEDQDWVRLTQRQFEPIRISGRLWIVPTWHAPPCPDAVNIVLDPGAAFGTGTHPTTRLALRWLEAQVHGGESMIDYGCGSGILAITSMKLGAARAFGLDIDDQALLAARHNAMQNRVDVRFLDAADNLPEPAQLLVANILANPLIVLAPLLARLTAGDGSLALSGILVRQADEVWNAYAPWFELQGRELDEGWVLLSGRRK